MSAIESLRAKLRAEAVDPYAGVIGMQVWDLVRDREVFSFQQDRRYMMASTSKMFTIAASLSLLGPERRVETKLFRDGEVAPDGTLQGDLYIQGAGDPSVGAESHIDRLLYGYGTPPVRFLEALKAYGVSTISGGVIGDSTAFDDKAKPTGRLSALTFSRALTNHPALSASSAIREALLAAGLEVESPPSEGTVPESAEMIGVIESPRVADICKAAGRRSDNFVAETLTKLIARHHDQSVPATTAEGVRIIRGHAASLGAEVIQEDGSGLSRKNATTPADVVRFLRRVLRMDWCSPFMESLSVMGLNGTLHDRGRNTVAQGTVVAKTGTHLSGKRGELNRGFQCSALSGYVCLEGAPSLAFSIMQEAPKSRYAAHSGQERAALALVEYSMR